MVNIDDFAKIEMKVGTVLEVEEIEGSDKLLKLKVDFGNAENPDSEESAGSQEIKKDIRQVLSGIKQWYTKQDLEGEQFVFVTNLEPRKMMGLESQAMIMAAEDDSKPVLLRPSFKVEPGSKIR